MTSSNFGLFRFETYSSLMRHTDVRIHIHQRESVCICVCPFLLFCTPKIKGVKV